MSGILDRAAIRQLYREHGFLFLDSDGGLRVASMTGRIPLPLQLDVRENFPYAERKAIDALLGEEET